MASKRQRYLRKQKERQITRADSAYIIPLPTWDMGDLYQRVGWPPLRFYWDDPAAWDHDFESDEAW